MGITASLEHICKLKGVSGKGLHVKPVLFSSVDSFCEERRREEKRKRGEDSELVSLVCLEFPQSNSAGDWNLNVTGKHSIGWAITPAQEWPLSYNT